MSKHTNRLRFSVIGLGSALLLFAAACTSDASSSTPSATPEGSQTPEGIPIPTSTAGPVDADAVAAYEEARDLWESSGIESYEFTLQRNCFCPPEFRGPFQITVTDGEVTDALYEGAAAEEAVAMTVDDVFDEIKEALDRGLSKEITYNETDGHPETVRLDLEAIAADGGFSVDLLDLTPSN